MKLTWLLVFMFVQSCFMGTSLYKIQKREEGGGQSENLLETGTEMKLSKRFIGALKKAAAKVVNAGKKLFHAGKAAWKGKSYTSCQKPEDCAEQGKQEGDYLCYMKTCRPAIILQKDSAECTPATLTCTSEHGEHGDCVDALGGETRHCVSVEKSLKDTVLGIKAGVEQHAGEVIAPRHCQTVEECKENEACVNNNCRPYGMHELSSEKCQDGQIRCTLGQNEENEANAEENEANAQPKKPKPNADCVILKDQEEKACAIPLSMKERMRLAFH